MSKSNAAPVRDWLLKKYQKTLRTIWEQTAELEQLRVDVRNRDQTIIENDQRFRQQARDMLASIEVQLSDGGALIPLDVSSTATQYTGGELVVQVIVELPESVEVPDSKPSMLDALSEALESKDFNKYMEAPGDHAIVAGYDGPSPAGLPSQSGTGHWLGGVVEEPLVDGQNQTGYQDPRPAHVQHDIYPAGAISAAFHC